MSDEKGKVLFQWACVILVVAIVISVMDFMTKRDILKALNDVKVRKGDTPTNPVGKPRRNVVHRMASHPGTSAKANSDVIRITRGGDEPPDGSSFRRGGNE